MGSEMQDPSLRLHGGILFISWTGWLMNVGMKSITK
jgi:hypothetical protein